VEEELLKGLLIESLILSIARICQLDVNAMFDSFESRFAIVRRPLAIEDVKLAF
jgi:hypothetical protein